MLRYILAFGLLIHGLIHFMGFAKAFGYGPIPKLTKNISKPLGSIWFFTTTLFMGTTVLLVFGSELWWLVAIIAIIFSEALIFTAWNNAKFGTIANVIILLFVIIAYGTWSFEKEYHVEVEKNLLAVRSTPDSILTEADIQLLPEPVRKYIRYTGSVGKPKVRNFKVEFTGKIRKDEQSAWMPFTSQQYNFTNAPTRLFFMKAKMMHLPVAGFHSYRNGEAYMDIRLFSLFNVQYQSSKEMEIAETVTFFNDMCCMAPATLIDKRIKWDQGDEHAVMAHFTNGTITIAAQLYFNDRGELINFVSNDRYATEDNNVMEKVSWSTPLKDYKEINGYRLPGYADAIYHYPKGDLVYGTFTLSDVEYNLGKLETN